MVACSCLYLSDDVITVHELMRVLGLFTAVVFIISQQEIAKFVLKSQILFMVIRCNHSAFLRSVFSLIPRFIPLAKFFGFWYRKVKAYYLIELNLQA